MTVGFFTLTGEINTFGTTTGATTYTASPFLSLALSSAVGTTSEVAGNPARGYMLIASTPSVIKDTTSQTTFVSPLRVYLKAGKFAVKLPTDATSGVSSTIRYRVTSQLRGGLADIGPIVFWAGAIGSTVDIADPTATPPAAPTNASVPYTVPFSV